MIRGTRRPSRRGTRGGGRGPRGPKGGTSRDTAPGCLVLAVVGTGLMVGAGLSGVLLQILGAR